MTTVHRLSRATEPEFSFDNHISEFLLVIPIISRQYIQYKNVKEIIFEHTSGTPSSILSTASTKNILILEHDIFPTSFEKLIYI